MQFVRVDGIDPVYDVTGWGTAVPIVASIPELSGARLEFLGSGGCG